jgi:saccharopine dehydrogenase (NAD+, L-lysine-forming)
MLYGAGGYTGTLIAQHAHESGHRPLLAGRTAPDVIALAERLDAPHRVFALDDPATLHNALADVDLVLNTAGPFLHTAAPLAEACLNTGTHYLDISNELRVFRTLYELDLRAKQADIMIIPGVGFGVVATNCLARTVDDVLGGAHHLEVAALVASAQPGPGVAATRQENIPFGGWIRQAGQLVPQEIGLGMTTLRFPNGEFPIMPVPTGDLEAAFQATGAPNIIAYSALVDPAQSGEDPTGGSVYRSFGWARAANSDGTSAEAWLETGESYLFTAAASVRSVEETLIGSQRGALSPAVAFGSDFPLSIPNTLRTEATHGIEPPARGL